MKKLKLLCLTVIIILLLSLSVSAEYYTARSLGMGGAYTGMAGDISSVLYNPASVSGESYLEIYASGGARTGQMAELQRLAGVFDGSLESTNLTADELEEFPDHLSGEAQFFAGGGLRYAALSSVMRTSLDASKEDVSGNTEAVVNSSFQRETMLTLGGELTSPPLNLGRLTLGANLKRIKKKNITYDYLLTDSGDGLVETCGSGGTMGVDAGILAQITSALSAGLQVRNLYTPEIEMEYEEKEKEYSDGKWVTTDSRGLEPETEAMTRSLRTGASLDLPLAEVTVAADVDNLLEEEKRIYHLGVEKRLIFNVLSLRAGRIAGSGRDPLYTAGLGLNAWKLHFDLGAGSSDGFSDDVALFTAARVRF
ncbi:MAG: hypothetical protein ACOCZM_00875 [Bacillota bacterium]